MGGRAEDYQVSPLRQSHGQVPNYTSQPTQAPRVRTGSQGPPVTLASPACSVPVQAARAHPCPALPGPESFLQSCVIGDSTLEVSTWKGYILSPTTCFFCEAFSPLPASREHLTPAPGGSPPAWGLLTCLAAGSWLSEASHVAAPSQ